MADWGTAAAVPTREPGDHARRVEAYTFVPVQAFTYASGAAPADAAGHIRRGDAFGFVAPLAFGFADASAPADAGPHSRRGDGYTFVGLVSFSFTEGAAPADAGVHARRGETYAFTPYQPFSYTEALAPGDAGPHSRRVEIYTFTPPQVFAFSDAAMPAPSGDHGLRVADFALGERSVARGEAFAVGVGSGTHALRGDAFVFVRPDAFFFTDATVPGVEPGVHSRRGDAYLRITIEGSGDLSAVGVLEASGQRRVEAVETVGLGTPAASGRRSDYEVVGLGVPVASGRRTDRECVGVGVLEATGQRSRAPEMVGMGAPEAFGQRPRDPETVGLGDLVGSGHRDSTAAGELVGVGMMEAGVVARPEVSGVGVLEASGQRLFRRRYLAPGWIKMRERQVEEWTTEPPPLDPQSIEVGLAGDSAWYGPFPAPAYYSGGDDFYPGDGYGSCLLPVDETTTLFVYRHNGASARWTPPPGSPYGSVERQESPICARRLTFDPATGAVSSGPEVTLTGHPLVDGDGGNDDPTYPWTTYPQYWSAFLISSSAGETRVGLRFWDEEGFYDPYPGRLVLYNGATYDDYGWSSAGIIVFTVNWGTTTVAKGPFNRIGGPVGVRPEFWGGTVETFGLPASQVYYDNPTGFEYWGNEPWGDRLILTQMLTDTRGVAAYASGTNADALAVTTFDVTGDTIAFAGLYQLPAGVSVDRPNSGSPPAKLVVTDPTRFVFAAIAYDPSIGAGRLRWWSFTVDGAGVITYQGAANSTDTWPNYDGELPTAAVRSDRVVFGDNDVSTGYSYALTVAQLGTGPPAFVPLLSETELAHPETPPVDSYGLVLGSDGAGHWAAVWHAQMYASPFEDHLYARAGHLDPGDVVMLSDPKRLSDQGTSYAYNWEWWGCWFGANHLAYGYLADRGDSYSVRTAVIEISGPDL